VGKKGGVQESCASHGKRVNRAHGEREHGKERESRDFTSHSREHTRNWNPYELKEKRGREREERGRGKRAAGDPGSQAAGEPEANSSPLLAPIDAPYPFCSLIRDSTISNSSALPPCQWYERFRAQVCLFPSSPSFLCFVVCSLAWIVGLDCIYWAEAGTELRKKIEQCLDAANNANDFADDGY